MAVEYILASKKDNTIGTIGLSIAVFESIAQYTIEEMNDVYLTISTNFRKNVNCKVENKTLIIDLDVIVKIGRNVNDLSHQIQNNVANEIYEMTSIKQVVVNVNVKGFCI
ncbi:MAG: Asp23/Gls24 family envelope stress response protein [Erysipelotrichaceae bacterium]